MYTIIPLLQFSIYLIVGFMVFFAVLFISINNMNKNNKPEKPYDKNDDPITSESDDDPIKKF